MGRRTKNPIVFLALSPASVATALNIHPSKVTAGIKSNALKVYVSGIQSRVLVSDVERWVRSWPQRKKRKRKVIPHA